MKTENIILKKLEKLENKLDNLNSSTYPLWLNIKQVSQYVNLATSTIRRMVSKNKIPYSRAGNSNKLIFNRKKIDIWLLTGDQNPNKRARSLAKEFIND